MKEFHPHIIVASISSNRSERMKNILNMVKEKFQEMGIYVFFMPENFSLEEAHSWVKDITDKNDFFLNFTFSETPIIYYKGETEKELAEIFAQESSRRTEEEYNAVCSFSSLNQETNNFLQNLPVHSYNINFSSHKSDKEIKMNIMACVTDICFLKHSLIDEKDRWAFRDVPSYHFAAHAIKKAKKKGIIPGYKGDVIYPNGGITRGEVIYMLDKNGRL